ncbi:MAG: cytochrome c oxidase accessory protein CcoG [Pseudomonadota bacterium]|nr:cytochrome c oxidase accessory protein CcoG [Pseudomonadota bacterium]
MSSPRRTIPIASAVAVEPAQHVYARSSSGPFTRARLALALLTQLFFFGMPWVQYDGRQAVLFDLAHQRFYFFGTLLLPQDLIYLTGLLIASAMLLFLATVLFGRVWCGFACPQTVYTALFMGIERRMEGDRSARMRLNQSPWGLNKLLRRGGKHLVWALLALWTGLSFVGWFTPIRELVQGLPSLSMGPWNTFWVLFYAGVTYLHAGVLRERICQHACPYGRFQSAMLDRNTLVVTYDQARGEPRGRRSAAAQASAAPVGDCVDCTLCVQVCPTGIDIRQGLQSACISCGVCIDACNGVMDKLKQPRGLIRFAPLQAGAQGLAQQLRKPRVWVYGGAILGVLVLMAVGLWQRPELRLDAHRDRGVMARMVSGGQVENVYRLQIRSASMQPQTLDIRVQPAGEAPAASLQLVAGDAQPVIEPAGTLNLPVTVRMPAEQAYALRGQTVPIQFEISGAGGLHQVQASSTFLVPR